MSHVVEVETLTVQFGDHVVLDEISVAFEKAKIHGIVGRNGSGKTVLFKCICELMPPTAGSICIGGQKIDNKTPIQMNVGIIIEHPGFLPNISGLKNLQLLADIRGLLSKDDLVKAMLTVGLDPHNKKRVGKYSMGMKQRLAIAQAFKENPELIILDEPFNGMDKDGVREMRKLIKSFSEAGKTVLLASHNPLDIEGLCDTVHELDKGSIVRVY